jgi:hypothetical protein
LPAKYFATDWFTSRWGALAAIQRREDATLQWADVEGREETG